MYARFHICIRGKVECLFVVATPAHRTGLTVAAAANHRFACLFLFDHADDDRCDDRDQHEANQDGADIIGDPIPHMIISCQN